MSFVSGPYKWTFNVGTTRQPLGITEDAPALRYMHNGVPILADAYGGNPIDAIYTGMTGMIGFVFQEWDAVGLQALLSRPGGIMGRFGELGCPFIEKQADVLIGQRLPFADCVTPEYFIAYRAAILPNNEIEIFFGGSRLRQVPIVFQLYPYARDTDATGGTPDTVQIFELLASLPANITKTGATSLATFISSS